MRFQVRLVGMFVAILVMSFGISTGQSTIFGKNIIINGNAESGAGSPDDSHVVAPPGWKTQGGFTVVQYGGSGGFPTKADPGPSARGKNLFAGGPNTPKSSADQTIDVSAGASAIDTGTVKYALTGYLGGFGSQGDSTTVTASFLGTTGVLGSAKIGPVTPVQRKNTTSLLPRTANGTLPKGTRKIDVVINTIRTDGAYDDGYSDNISLILKK